EGRGAAGSGLSFRGRLPWPTLVLRHTVRAGAGASPGVAGGLRAAAAYRAASRPRAAKPRRAVRVRAWRGSKRRMTASAPFVSTVTHNSGPSSSTAQKRLWGDLVVHSTAGPPGPGRRHARP